MSDAGHWDESEIPDLEDRGIISLGRGNIISKIDIQEKPGGYPIYSSSAKGDGMFGKYGDYMFDEEMITWSIDGGGTLFYRPKHKFSVTNVCGYMRLDTSVLDYRFVHAALCLQHSRITFDYQTKAHPSVIRNLYRIPIPSLPEQKKIAEILSGIDRRIQADKSLLSKIEDTLQGLRDQTQFGEGRQARIGDLVARITTGTSVSGENRHCNASEHGVLKVSCVSKGEFLPKENKVIVGENKERATMPVRQGMLLMSRANTPELVGACGITNSDYSNLYLPDKVWNLELADTAECSKEWLNNALNSQVGRSKIRDASTGTSDSMRNISQRNFLETEILVPPIATQKRQSDLIDSLLTKKRMTAINLEKYLMLKEALSSDLLSGRKRVSV